MTAVEIRKKFLDFFAGRGHKVVPSASLLPTGQAGVPAGDPSVLLTTAGMQQFKEYYTDASAARREFGTVNLVSIQKSFRTSDIDEVGDDTHLTFFEMLGNFSFGGYGKQKAIDYAHEFIVRVLGLTIDYVTIFGGDQAVARDDESKKIWQSLSVKDIRESGRADNFWGPTGIEGPCGPTTEIYVDGIEIWNLVFNEYYCQPNGTLEKLATLGVDTGMGLERLTAAVQKKNNIFETDLFVPLLDLLPVTVTLRTKRILVDHARAVCFLIADGVRPANKNASYILRRLLRRIMSLKGETGLKRLFQTITTEYKTVYPALNYETVVEVFADEETRFSKSLQTGLGELAKLTVVDAAAAFKLYETHGLPFEVIKDRVPDLSRGEFEKEFERHQQVSRVGAVQKFSGGLADSEPATVRLHTAHHLLLAALQLVLGRQVKQRGSNINQERLRLDFSFKRKLTNEEKQRTEDLVNQKIRENLPVVCREMSRAEAEKLGAEMEFGQKYGERVSVYFIGENNASTDSGRAFSAEFCGGPHVAATGELAGVFKIIKEEAVSAGVRRIKAVLVK